MVSTNTNLASYMFLQFNGKYHENSKSIEQSKMNVAVGNNGAYIPSVLSQPGIVILSNVAITIL